MSNKSFTDELSEFFEEFKDVEVSFQSKRDFTDPKKLGEYIRELEGAVRHFSSERLDKALGLYRERLSEIFISWPGQLEGIIVYEWTGEL